MAKKRAHRPEGFPRTENQEPRPPAARPATRPRRSARQRFEDASRPAVQWMSRRPTFLIPVVLAAMLFAGLAIPATWAAAFLLFIAAFLTWLTALSWPVIATGSRVLRVVVDVGMFVLAVLKLLGLLLV